MTYPLFAILHDAWDSLYRKQQSRDGLVGMMEAMRFVEWCGRTCGWQSWDTGNAMRKAADLIRAEWREDPAFARAISRADSLAPGSPGTWYAPNRYAPSGWHAR